MSEQGVRFELTGVTAVDHPPIARAPWLTQRRLVGFVLGWIALFGLFLFPTLTLEMLAAEQLVARRRQSVIGSTTLAGATIAFMGLLVFVFVDPERRGSGYILSTVGLAIIGSAILATTWYSTLGAARAAHLADAPPLPPATTP